jgi:RNA polymerase sigma factor (sigma-70 family)
MASGQPSPLLRHIRRLAGAAADGEQTDGQLLESFVSQHDQAAFEALLWRHGPMVLGTCRRITRGSQDAEDAFQATFLVLCRKAGSISRYESIGSWLHKVAFRIALKVKADAVRQAAANSPNLEAPAPDTHPELLWKDQRPMLDEELGHLPEKYRLPLVLHYLEGKTVAEVARELRWPSGTVLGRLARARDRLRTRLVRRGITLSAGALAPLLTQSAEAGPLPMLLATSTLKLAALSLLGQAALPGSIAPKAAILAKGMVQAMLLTKLKITAVILLTTTLIAAGGGALLQQAIAERLNPAEQPTGPAARHNPVENPKIQGDRLLPGAQPGPSAGPG